MFYSIRYLFILVIISSQSSNITRLDSLSCPEPGANKSTYSFCPDITQERLWQAIKLTNYRTIFATCKTPGCCLYPVPQTRFKGLKFKGRTREVAQLQRSRPRHNTNHRQAKDTHANHVSRLTAMDISTKTSLVKKKSCHSALPSDGCCYGIFDVTKISL